MEAFVRNENLVVRVYRLPTLAEISEADKHATDLLRNMQDVTVRIEIFNLNARPSRKHLVAISSCLAEVEDKVKNIVLAHRGGMIVKKAQSMFFRLFHSHKDIKIESLDIYDDSSYEIVDLEI